MVFFSTRDVRKHKLKIFCFVLHPCKKKIIFLYQNFELKSHFSYSFHILHEKNLQINFSCQNLSVWCKYNKSYSWLIDIIAKNARKCFFQILHCVFAFWTFFSIIIFCFITIFREFWNFFHSRCSTACGWDRACFFRSWKVEKKNNKKTKFSITFFRQNETYKAVINS